MDEVNIATHSILKKIQLHGKFKIEGLPALVTKKMRDVLNSFDYKSEQELKEPHWRDVFSVNFQKNYVS